MVAKVEPPNWWVGHSLNPVRLLVQGRNLGAARVESSSPKLKIGVTRVNASGSFLFVDILIEPGARIGFHSLTIATSRGTAEIPFRISQPLAAGGRFQGFSGDDVTYLLMPDRFANGDPSNDDPPQSPGLLNRHKSRYYHGGDLQGIIDHLPYLEDLGITALWMNPIYDNVNHLNRRETYDNKPITDYHGYGAVDFYSVEEHFGDRETFKELVDQAHTVGIKIIQDQVANHTGPYHLWAKDPPTPTWFNGTSTRHLANNWRIWTLADPHAGANFRKPTLEGWFLDLLPDLNQENEETARYLIQNTLWWIGVSGLDGIRQDTLPYVPRSFWHRWRAAIAREYPRFTVVGEMWDSNPALVAFFQGGQARFDGIDSGIEALFDFPLYYALRAVFAEGKPADQLARVFAQDRLYADPTALMTFVGLHDVPRFMSEPGADSVGLKLAYTLILTARGMPVIYYGDEIGMRGGADPDNRRDFPGGWPEDERDAFGPSGRTREENDVHDALRHLIRLRRQSEALRRGRMVHLLVTEKAYAYARMSEHDTVIVVFNTQSHSARLEFSVAPARLGDSTRLEDRLGSASEAQVREGRIEVILPERSAAVYTIRELE
ncbi:MAG: alpha-amylase family glycosyl hydrolase [Acidobacteriota bacterium]